MGGNAKRRRDAKARKAGEQLLAALGSMDSPSFSRMFRSNCSECGSANITWSTLGELAAGDGPRVESAREILPRLGASADAWVCDDCEGFGAFEQQLQTSWD
jgi:hypothetical protein